MTFSENGAPSVGPLLLCDEAMSAHDFGVIQAGFLLTAGIEDDVLVTLCESPSGMNEVPAVLLIKTLLVEVGDVKVFVPLVDEIPLSALARIDNVDECSDDSASSSPIPAKFPLASVLLDEACDRKLLLLALMPRCPPVK